MLGGIVPDETPHFPLVSVLAWLTRRRTAAGRGIPLYRFSAAASEQVVAWGPRAADVRVACRGGIECGVTL